jgi:hypothetical protein
METEILKELSEIKFILAKVTGTSDLETKNRFSVEALDKAAKDFQQMCIDREEYIDDWKIDTIIKGGHRSGAFIRNEFGFSNFFKRGSRYYYNKTDLVALANELKARNVDLRRYMELREDEEKFKKSLDAASSNTQAKRGKKFDLPFDVRDIVTSSPKAPSADVVRAEIANLKEEFFEFNMADYVDIHKGNHAMLKSEYYFEKYIKPDIKKRCKRWCENFNYANNALKLITNKIEKFNPVKDDDMIQL